MTTLIYKKPILVIFLPPFDLGQLLREDVWNTYWFEKNLQGDVIAVYDQAGTKLVSYKYDAWGYTSITYHNSGSSTTAKKNPFKYRGYYYDADLGLYYLNTRYYDSNKGRFISADGYISTGQGILGYNMYAYCNNNPVMYADYSGKLLLSILGLAALTTVLITTLGSSTDMRGYYQEEAEQKYNENTININGNNPKGTINVTVSENGQTIHIENSHNISNSYEQSAILKTITNSEWYSSDYKDIETMIIEWSGHNFGYLITKNKKVNSLVSKLLGRKNANSNFESVDIHGVDTNQSWYNFVTLGGVIEW